MSNFMITFRGNRFYVDAPERTKFEIEDIAHALSHLCRFGGHTSEFYSVAQHSWVVSRILEYTPGTTPQQWLLGLMHDATEAYMVDVPTPLKRVLPDYERRETGLYELIAGQMNLPHMDPKGLTAAAIKRADREALVMEAARLIPGGLVFPVSGDSGYRRDDHLISPGFECWDPKLAKAVFLNRWEWLLKECSK